MIERTVLRADSSYRACKTSKSLRSSGVGAVTNAPIPAHSEPTTDKLGGSEGARLRYSPQVAKSLPRVAAVRPKLLFNAPELRDSGVRPDKPGCADRVP